MLAGRVRNDVAADGGSVYGDAFYASLHTIGILHRDSVFAIAETAGYGVFLSRGGKARTDGETTVVGLYAEDILAYCEPHPCGSALEISIILRFVDKAL